MLSVYVRGMGLEKRVNVLVVFGVCFCVTVLGFYVHSLGSSCKGAECWGGGKQGMLVCVGGGGL